MVSSMRASRVERLENAISIGVLGTMALLPVVQVVGRTVVGQGLPGSIPLVQHLTLWIALLGAALAARSDRLLALSTTMLFSDRLRVGARWVGMSRSTFACGGCCASCQRASPLWDLG